MNIKEKRVIIVNYTGKRGGGALDSLEMAKALVLNGEKVVPIISNQIDNLNDWKAIKFEKIITIKTYSSVLSFIFRTIFFRVLVKKTIIKEIKDYSVKAIYSPMIAFWTGKINSIFKNAIKIISVHDPVHHSGSNPITSFLLDRSYSKADLLIVHSSIFTEYTKEKFNKETMYLPLGLHDYYLNHYSKSLIDVKETNAVDFLFFGRIEDYKGLDILLRAFKQIEENCDSNCTLTIVGEGDLQKYSQLLNDIKRVTVVNNWIPSDEVGTFFRGNNKICVCPYKDATQSGIILMSYSFGVPVIASNTGGLSEQVIDGVTGLLVEPNKVDCLFRAMKKVLDDSSILYLYKQGIKDFLTNFSWENSAKKLLRAIDKKLLENKRYL